jgi:hypothetical protein
MLWQTCCALVPSFYFSSLPLPAMASPLTI